MIPALLAAPAVAHADVYGQTSEHQVAQRGVRQHLRVTYNQQSCQGTTMTQITKVEAWWDQLQSTSRISFAKLNVGSVGSNCNGSWTENRINTEFTPSFGKVHTETPNNWAYRSCMGFCAIGGTGASPGGAVAANLSVLADDQHGTSKLCSTWAASGSTNC